MLAASTALGLGACNGKIGGGGAAGNGGGGTGGGANTVGGGGGSNVNPGQNTGSTSPIDPAAAEVAVRKVKYLLVGLAPTDDDVNTVATKGEAGLQTLISNWLTDDSAPTNFQDKVEANLIGFFRNMFQQVGFTPTVDFMPQLLPNGGFDFGPLGTAAVGDDAFPRLVQNLQDSFALTAWQLVKEGTAFSSVLTTQKFMMTTGLKSLYIQIEMPNDQPYNFTGGANTTAKLQWKLDYVNTIPFTDTLNPSSPNYMVFDDEVPAITKPSGSFGGFVNCHGVGDTVGTPKTVVTFGGPTNVQAPTGGYAQLFQRLLGYSPRWPFVGQPDCVEHPSKPYFTAADMSDWQWVTIVPKAASDTYIQPYDIPTLEQTTTLKLALPRIGFYTTAAYLALWNTNDSNQHRVTTNQTLLAALGQSFTNENTITPLSEAGLDAGHTVNNPECNGCHKSLDPMRMFWGNQFDFNDRNDFPAQNFNGGAPNPRPASPFTDGFAFGDVNTTGASMADLAPLLLQVTDQDPTSPLPLFAINVAQQLCFWANSAPCDTSDPTFRSIVTTFKSDYNFAALVKNLFSSSLITGVGTTQSFPFDSNGQSTVPISISRRAHLCAALSNKLGVSDLCALTPPLPTTAQTATATIAGSVAADVFSRGAQSPVTPADPNLFYRAASEILCENIANQVVDNGSTSVYLSTNDLTTNATDMVERILGYPPSSNEHDMAVSILVDHYNTAKASTTSTTQGGRTVSSTTSATTALRSTFSLACQSPSSLGIGL